MPTPEEIAAEKLADDIGIFLPRQPAARKSVTEKIAKAIRAAEERGRASTQADVNECGVWCPKCGAHLRAPR